VHLSQDEDEDEDETVQAAIAASFDGHSIPHESGAHEVEDHILIVTRYSF